MSFYTNIKSAKLTNAHGEVNFFKIEDGNADLAGFVSFEPNENGYIVGHSESGHNHVLERGDVEVKSGTVDGMQILYAILKEPLKLRQLVGHPHSEQIVEVGTYFITNNVDYDPFAQQARRVAD